MNEYKISVIIPVRNGANKIERCIEGVLSQSLKPHEVIIVDGHSDDDTIERAKKFPVKILFEDYHTRAGACQVGIEHTEGDYIAFTDSDCIPDKEWLANLATELKGGIAGVGGSIKSIGEDFWIHSINLAYSTFLGSANSVQGRTFKDRRFVNSISGCNSIYHKRDLLMAGGFKTRLPGAEDADLNSRLLKIGKLVYVPQAIIYHDHGRGLKDFAKQMFRYGIDRGVARKFALQTVPPLLLPLVFLSLILNLWILPSLFALYILVLLGVGLRFAVREKDIKYIFSIPVVFVVEHSLYSLGFWRGLVIRK